jgi:hypothetical protein
MLKLPFPDSGWYIYTHNMRTRAPQIKGPCAEAYAHAQRNLYGAIGPFGVTITVVHHWRRPEGALPLDDEERADMNDKWQCER